MGEGGDGGRRELPALFLTTIQDGAANFATRLSIHLSRQRPLKVETFPFTRYRTIPGVVSFVSNDAVQNEKRGPTFQVRVKLDRGSLVVDQREVNLSPGMAVSAEVMTDKRRVVAYLLDPVRKTTTESFREK